MTLNPKSKIESFRLLDMNLGFDGGDEVSIFQFHDSTADKIPHDPTIYSLVIAVEIQIHGFFIPLSLHQVVKKQMLIKPFVHEQGINAYPFDLV